MLKPGDEDDLVRAGERPRDRTCERRMVQLKCVCSCCWRGRGGDAGERPGGVAPAHEEGQAGDGEVAVVTGWRGRPGGNADDAIVLFVPGVSEGGWGAQP